MGWFWFIVGFVSTLVFFIKYKRSLRSISERDVEISQKEIEFEELKSRAKKLLKYQQIEDAEKEASRIVKEAESVLGNAQAEASKIKERAEDEAQNIAGAALEAKDKAGEYKNMAKAMKNVIEGYGDEYLIPNKSALDDLADEFDHKEAGKMLKEARAATTLLIKEKKAADCDYKERNRRETAIHFVLDAYNGKVDSILSNVKHNNLGKMRQQMDDARSLVNLNGEAFKNAKILNEFHEARLNELKWAVAAHELKLQDREEQRAIREAMREEERARRDYEKAIKQAEKEERMLEKAMKEAKKLLESAAEDERKQYEQQIADLEKKWQEAEEKNQRAISMAQQTRRGHVYVISNVGSFGENVYKIGLTRRLEPMDRVKELGDASVPFEFDVHAMFHSEDAPALENELHKLFEADRVNKLNYRKEFFNLSIARIKEAVDEKGIETHWTMKSEAREYRESMAMAKNARSAGTVGG